LTRTSEPADLHNAGDPSRIIAVAPIELSAGEREKK
jgi:hypothetical protein